MVHTRNLGVTMEGEGLQMSDTLYNPVVRVRVVEKSEITQLSWAFYFTATPRYRREEMLGFRILEFSVEPQYVAIPKDK